MDMHELVAQQCLNLPTAHGLESVAMRKGLQSTIRRLRVRPTAAAPAPAPRTTRRTVVVKELLGTHRREADAYRLLWGNLARPPAPRLLGSTDTTDASYLCLEDVPAVAAWPWRDLGVVTDVCQVLARLHRSGIPAARLPAWDYEEHLRGSAQETLGLARWVTSGGMSPWRRLGDLARVVDALPEIRERLLASGATLIHGDVHPGNVLVRAGAGPDRVVLIDWAASRLGSPLEDIACWLHSLGCWDAEVRRRHDSLLAGFLRASQPGASLDGAVRARYWLASASNGLAGAIRYHLAMVGDPQAGGRARQASRRSLDEWQRVIRGVAALLRTRRGLACA